MRILANTTNDPFGSQAALFRHSSLMSALRRKADSQRLFFRLPHIERLLSPIAVVREVPGEGRLTARSGRSIKLIFNLRFQFP